MKISDHKHGVRVKFLRAWKNGTWDIFKIDLSPQEAMDVSVSYGDDPAKWANDNLVKRDEEVFLWTTLAVEKPDKHSDFLRDLADAPNLPSLFGNKTEGLIARLKMIANLLEYLPENEKH